MYKGRVTIPTNKGFEKETKEIMRRWRADAVRDCDGTVLPDNIKQFGAKVYSTYFVIRGDNVWARANPDEFQHLYLMSERITALSDTVEIELLKGYFTEQVAVSYSNPHKYWEVTDRTSGRVIDGWTVDEKCGTVTIKGAERMHEYTVSFLALSLWDPVQIYNYTTNNWDVEKHHMYDPMYPKTREYVIRHLKEWCEANPETDVIRFTTFLYQFGLVFNDKRKESSSIGSGTACP
jgi:Lacto-N-biose phosphorylase.